MRKRINTVSLLRDYKEGYTNIELSVRYGVTASTIRNHLIKEGVYQPQRILRTGAKRKPHEITKEEMFSANERLPERWFYIPRDNSIEVANNPEDGTSEISLVDIKKLTDYLTSINVDPYGE